MNVRASHHTALLLSFAISCTALGCTPSPRHDAGERDAAPELEDAGAALDAGGDASAPAADGGQAPVIGLDFLPIETRTSDEIAQTVAHMELTGLAFRCRAIQIESTQRIRARPRYSAIFTAIVSTATTTHRGR